MKKVILGSFVVLLVGIFTFGVFASMAKITLKNVKGVGTLVDWPHLAHQKNAKKEGCKACHTAMPGKMENIKPQYSEANSFAGCTGTDGCHDAAKLISNAKEHKIEIKK